MKNKISFGLLLVSIFQFACDPKTVAPIPPKSSDTTSVSIDVSNVVRNLSGDEVGLNVNYLMDDEVISGNNYNKTIQTIKQMGPKILRYPGGEKSDNYYFSSPPYASAAPRAIYCAWPSTDTRFFNSDRSCKNAVLDFDEFMDVCAQTQAKPLIVVAYDPMYSPWGCGPNPLKSALIRNAQEWVRYANIVKGYGIKLWMIGNESWLTTSYNGNTTPQQYAIDIAQFADSMRVIDPTIQIIANGRANWWPVLLSSSAASKIDYLAVSNYLPYDIPISSYEKFKNNTASLNYETDKAIASIENAVSSTDKSRIKVIEAEYNSLDFTNGWDRTNDLGHALCSFQMLADAVGKPKLYSACFWNTRWVESVTNPQQVYDAMDKDGKMNANGLAVSILGKNLLSTMVFAGSPKNKLHSYASYDGSSKKLRIFLLNKETIEKKVKLNISNYLNSFTYEKWVFSGIAHTDKFPIWTMSAANQTGNRLIELTLAPHSVTMISSNP